jgi:hypothetical protein
VVNYSRVFGVPMSYFGFIYTLYMFAAAKGHGKPVSQVSGPPAAAQAREHHLHGGELHGGRHAAGARRGVAVAGFQPADRRIASLRFASLRFASKRFASLRFASLRFARLRFAPPRSGRMSGVLITPCVPCLHALPEQCDMLVVRHRSIPVPIQIFSGKRVPCKAGGRRTTITGGRPSRRCLPTSWRR